MSNTYASDFWALRSQYAPAEIYYFSLLLYPRVTILYMYLVDLPAVSIFLVEPSMLSLFLFGIPMPHLLAAYNFYGAFAATNWITTISFVIGSLKEWVRDFGMFITLLTTSVLFFSGSSNSNELAWQAIRSPLIFFCTRLAIWVAIYGGTYTLLIRPFLPQIAVDCIFVILAADTAGFQFIKPLGKARDSLYAKVESILLPKHQEQEDATSGNTQGHADTESTRSNPGGANAYWFSFSSGPDGRLPNTSGTVHSGNLNEFWDCVQREERLSNGQIQ